MDLVTQQLHERRERILAAARELIGERGYQALTMRDLAARCRVSIPTLYNQFGSKSALMAAAVQLHFGRLLAGARDRDGASGVEQLIEVVKLCGREMTRIPEYHRALVGAFMEIRETDSTQAALTANLGAEIEGALAAMQRRRQLAAWVDARVLASQITRAFVASSAGWALGELDDAGLEAAMLHAACGLAASGARGEARAALEREVRAAQTVLATPRSERQAIADGAATVSARR